MMNVVSNWTNFYKKGWKPIYRTIIWLSLLQVSYSCTSPDDKKDAFDTGDHKIENGTPLKLKLKLSSVNIDSIAYYLEDSLLAMRTDTASIVLKSELLGFGEKLVKAHIYRGIDHNVVSQTILIVPPAPKEYAFSVIHTYVHDTLAYTQGLEMADGFLYESTGSGDGLVSSIRKTDIQTGKILSIREFIGADELDIPLFMEGLTFVKDQLILLTWQNNFGLVLDKASFRELNRFHYGRSLSGWGICFDGEKLIKSDGSSNLFFLDKDDYKEIGSIPVYDNSGLIDIDVLNELEFVDGMVYANHYGKDEILIIDPQKGAVVGRVNCIGLHRTVVESNREMNGIAYDKKTGNLFVTGKQWDTLYEIRLVQRQ